MNTYLRYSQQEPSYTVDKVTEQLETKQYQKWKEKYFIKRETKKYQGMPIQDVRRIDVKYLEPNIS